jgi:hypothetical protein
MRIELKVSEGGHISVNWRKSTCDRYLAEEDPDGTITLIPAALVPAVLRKDSPYGTKEMRMEHPE